jgi:hypothetical protein
MKRATSVYVIMLVAFGIGLWAIITTGSVFLRAPHDLSGGWELSPIPSGAQTTSISELNIDQSGRFFRVTFDGQSHALSLASEEHRAGTRDVQVQLSGSNLQLDFQNTANPREYHLRASGTIQGQWLAVRAKPGQRRTPSTAPTTQHARS